MYVYTSYTEQGDNNEIIHWFTVGFYRPDGEFEPESDHDNTQKAARRVNYLNGGRGTSYEA